MDAKQSFDHVLGNLILSERQQNHLQLMLACLAQLSDTPLVLKGGTALYLAYGLNRFSEDLDFDSSARLNLTNRLNRVKLPGFKILDLNLKKDTAFVTRYLVHYENSLHNPDVLKLEISYRTPVPESQVFIHNGLRFASLVRIVDNKLSAAFDGEYTRTKGRDLFDLHYVAKNYSQILPPDLCLRLYHFAKDPSSVASRYKLDVESDILLNRVMDVDIVAIELAEISEQLVQGNAMALDAQNHFDPCIPNNLNVTGKLLDFEKTKRSQAATVNPKAIKHYLTSDTSASELSPASSANAQSPRSKPPSTD